MNVSNELSQYQLLKVNDVARVLAVSPRHVWNLIARGDLRSVRLGERVTRVRTGDLKAYIGEPYDPAGDLEES